MVRCFSGSFLSFSLYIYPPAGSRSICLNSLIRSLTALYPSIPGRYLASSSADLSIRIWKRVEKYRFECVLVIPGLTDADSNVDANSNLKGHSRSVYSVSWGVGLGGENRETRNGKGKYLGWLASAGGDGSIMVWELEVSKGLGLGLFVLHFSFSCFLFWRSFSPPTPNSVSVRVWLLVISFFTFHVFLSPPSTAPPDAWRVLCFPHHYTPCPRTTYPLVNYIYPILDSRSPQTYIYRKLGMMWGVWVHDFSCIDGSVVKVGSVGFSDALHYKLSS